MGELFVGGESEEVVAWVGGRVGTEGSGGGKAGDEGDVGEEEGEEAVAEGFGAESVRKRRRRKVSESGV